MRSLLLVSVLSAPVLAQSPPTCDADLAAQGTARYLARVAAGELPDPAARRPWLDAAPVTNVATTMLVTPDDVFPYEDSTGLLLQEFDFDVATPFLVEAINALIGTHGDVFDFVGLWTSYDPNQFVSMFYIPVRNDVQGIGLAPFDDAASLGITSAALQGFLMMWDVNSPFVAPGAGPDADLVRLLLQHELAHRFALYLPPLAPGKPFQGEDFVCGRPGHWHFRTDAQASAIEISEWIGVSPALRVDQVMGFNGDIPGGLYSYPDLYLMGYVTPAEMDAGASELRYMDASDCVTPYNGPITAWDASDLIAAAGPRVPDSASAQKDFRTGWIMLYLPGEPPTLPERQKAAGILNQATLDWSVSTLGRGTMNHTLGVVSVFVDLGFALAGTNGTPTLEGVGTLESGTPVQLDAASLLASRSATLIAGAENLSAPFKGGVLVPALDVLLPGLVTEPDGSLGLGFTMPVGVPPGVPIHLQVWQKDPGGPKGFGATNAIVGTTP